MKKVLCYLGILFFLFLTVLPPVLRTMLPEYGEEKEEEVVIVTTVLSCTSDDFIVNTSYENDKIRMIVMKKMKEVENTEENNDNNQENVETENELVAFFDDIKTKSGITSNVLEDGEVVALDFKLYTFDNLNLTKYTKSMDEQKNYYESQGLSCITRK